jgi:8-oxo-dGTP pyrophosphatase MutT (NUDIX family)
MRMERSWGAVVTDKRGRFLLVHHASGNHWDHPKGHAEKGESPQETALREIREEAQIIAEITDGFIIETGWTLPDGRPKKVTYYLAHSIGDCEREGPEGEIIGKVWLSYGDARKKITYETGKEVLDKARDFIGTAPEVIS